MAERLFKSSAVLVARRFDAPGLNLKHQRNGRLVQLDPAASRAWLEWSADADVAQLGSSAEVLCTGEFLMPVDDARVEPGTPTPLDDAQAQLDEVVPRLEPRFLRWYAETPDLCVLFNTRRMAENNPLLALSPYGSLIWRGIVAGECIGELRRRCGLSFGHDGVTAFLARLVDNGMLQPIPGLDRSGPSEPALTAEFPAPGVQFALTHAAVPWYCLWELNTACDLRCDICYLPHFKSPGPSEPDAQAIARQIIDAGIFYVCLLGGESLLRKDLERIVAHLREAGLFVKVISNGQRLDERRLAQLNAAGLNMIEVSFDGLTPEVHEASRGAGTWQRSLAAVRNIHASDIPRMAMVFTVHSGNFDQLEQCPEFMAEHGITECYISQFKRTGLNGERSVHRPIDAAQQGRAGTLLEQFRASHPERTITLLPNCSCGRTSTVIGHAGDVRTCSFSYMTNVGNVLERPFGEIWKSLEPRIPVDGPVGYCTSEEARERPNAALTR